MSRREMALKKEKGQALVEYVLVLVMAVGIAVSIEQITRRSIKSIWTKMAADIAAPCPTSMGCIAPEGIQQP